MNSSYIYSFLWTILCKRFIARGRKTKMKGTKLADTIQTLLKLADKEYYYEIRTGSYPQIHHTNALPTAKGWINCSSFVDANGKEYNGWIPAIKLA